MDHSFNLDAEVVQLIKSRSVEVPTYPGVALKLQRVISSGDFGLDVLSKLVLSDQSLATHVMRAANSAFHSASAPATTLPQAINRIGARELANIAIAGTLGLTGSMAGPLSSLRKESWRASLISALLCQELAKGREVDAGEAFLAGMLHDFGETIAYACFEAILEKHPAAAARSAAAWQWEGQRYHVELGMILAAEWKLPPFIGEAVSRHTDLELAGAECPKLIELVSACDGVVLRLLETASADQVLEGALPGVRSDERERLRSLLPRIPAFLQAFDDDKAAAPPSLASPPTLVTAPDTTLTGRRRAVSFAVTVTSKDKQRTYQATEWCPTGLRMTGQSPLAERHLINLELEGGLKCSATVLLSSVSDAGCIIELKPFALSKPNAALWAKLGEAAATP